MCLENASDIRFHSFAAFFAFLFFSLSFLFFLFSVCVFFSFCLRRIKKSFAVLYRKQTAPGRFLNVAFGAAKRI